MEILELNYTFTKGKFKDRDIKYLVDNLSTDYLKYFLRMNKDKVLSKESLNYIFKNINCSLSSKFQTIMEKLDSPISSKFMELIRSGGMISKWTNIRINVKNPEMVIYDVPYSKKDNEIKVSRFIRSVLNSNNIETSSSELEDFLIKYLEFFKTSDNIKVVSGDDIIKYYDSDNYSSGGGTLGRSCMRHSKCRNQLKFYSKNSNDIQMLVLLDNFGKVKGRALIWKNVNISYLDPNLDVWININSDLMDRVYVINSKDRAKFKSYADKNKMAFRTDFRAGSNTNFTINGMRVRCVIKTNELLINNDYPHLDTLCYSKWISRDKISLGNA
jgi:hypothetical protein